MDHHFFYFLDCTLQYCLRFLIVQFTRYMTWLLETHRYKFILSLWTFALERIQTIVETFASLSQNTFDCFALLRLALIDLFIFVLVI